MSREAISPVWIAVALIGLGAASLGIWYFFMERAPSVDIEPQVVPANSAKDSGPVAATEPPPRAVLPPLDESDAKVREWAATLSEHPQLATWLVPDHLVRRLVASVDNIARGESPRPHLSTLAPEGAFQARLEGDRTRVDARSYKRYELLTDVFTSLDIAGTARLYHDLEPLLEESYQELGDPDREFRDVLAAAIDRLLAVDVPAGSPELQREPLFYRYSDPELEVMTPAEKHLLRLGPENAAKVQTKLRFLRAALDLPPAELSLTE